MKTPDKIFVPTRFRLVDGLRVRESDTDEEYIRKDALLEWAKETYLNENASLIRKVCYKQLIDKINSV